MNVGSEIWRAIIRIKIIGYNLRYLGIILINARKMEWENCKENRERLKKIK